MSDLEIRPADRADLPAIRDLVYAIAEEFGFTPEPEGVDADLNADSERYFEPDACLDVLVDEGGGVRGVLGVVPHGSDGSELRKLYVDSTLRGGGHGHRLLERAIAFARELGARRMVLQTNERLLEAAKLYERAGFQRTPMESRRSETCDLRFELRLGSGDEGRSR